MKQEKPGVGLRVFLYRVLTCLKRIVQIPLTHLKNLRRKSRAVFLIGTPEYGNMGDQLIALGELEWLRAYDPGADIRERTHESLMRDKGCRLLLAEIRPQDLLLLQGGGNLNDKYMNCEYIRRTILQKCPENAVVLLPQSVHFAQTPAAQKEKAETERVYNAHSRFTIFAREDTSFRLAQEMFPDVNVRCSPDMATFLFGRLAPSRAAQREGIGWCIRDDREKYYSDEALQAVFDKLSASHTVTKTDTHLYRAVSPANRRAEVQALIDRFAGYRVIVTDRFHGMIYAALAGTPCIVLRSGDHKIVDGVKWFSGFGGILPAKSPEEIPALLENALCQTEIGVPDFSAYFQTLYQIIQDQAVDL